MSVLTDKKEENEFGLFAKYDGNIIYFKPNKQTREVVEHAQGSIDFFHQIRGQELVGLIVDIQGAKKGVTKEIRTTISNGLKGYLYASAILVDNGISKIIGNLVLNFSNKAGHRRRIFTSEKEAIAWLLSERKA